MPIGAREFKAGDNVGSFRLVSPLGEGAMGRVWRVDGPGGPAALKLLTAEMEGIRERFELEARALMKLRHPNVIRAVDYGHADDDTPFIALELLDGETLEERLQETRRLPAAEALHIASEAAIGLHAAHEIGIVHRDVKPGNIFLCGDGNVKVIDFGIAFWSPTDGRLPVSRLTKPGTVMGTPSYMAPEQAMGEGDEDPRTDVWGLGAVLYDMIAGRTPFDAGQSFLAELTRILTEPPDPLPPDVPADVQALVLRALSKSQNDRFATMIEFAEAARRSEGPTAARPIQRESGVIGALSDEVRLVAAVLVEGLTDPEQRFEALAVEQGGRGSRLRGGGAVAIFGGEQWIGDESERAVRFALEVRGRAQRVGVGTGKAVQSLARRGGVTGEALAAAEHALQIDEPAVRTLAPPAMINVQADTARPARLGNRPTVVAVCPATQRRVRGAFEIAAGRIIGVRPGGRALQPREVGGREVPFVGRSQELDALIDFFEEVDEHERAAACVIAGPPGIGKSRLRFELLRWFEDEELEVRPFEARGELTAGQASFAVIRELLRRHAQLPEGTDEARGRIKIESLVAAAHLEDTRAAQTAHFIGELLGVSFSGGAALRAARDDPQLMADGIRVACGALFAGLTEHDCVLVMIEDAQWADAASLSLLESLIEQLHDRPFAVIATARPNFFVEREAFADATRIDLGELAPEAVGEIVQSVLGRAEPEVVERAAGNPYLAEELSMAVREGASPDALPLTVEGAVLARLDKLAPDEKDLLKRAAILGRRFWLEALQALGEPLAKDLLLRLRRRELVVPRSESQLEGCHEWIFRQAVVFEVCQGLLTDDQRKELHKAAASWLSRRNDAVAEEVAFHFEAARDGKRALLWWLRAVHSARERGESRDVLRCAGRVVDLAPLTSLPAGELFEMRLLRCEACFWLAERAALEAELQLAWRFVEGHEGQLGTGALARLRCWLAEHLAQEAHFDEAARAARDAMRIADDSDLLPLRVRSRRVLSEVLGGSGDLDEAAKVANDALDIAKRGEGGMIRATAARAAGHVELRRGHVSAALFYFEMARNLCLEHGAQREATLSRIGLAQGFIAVGAYESAERVLDKALAAAQAIALRSVVGWVKVYRAWVVHRRGDHAAALVILDQVVAAAGKLGDIRLAITGYSYRAIVYVAMQQAHTGIEDAGRAVALATGRAELADKVLARGSAVLTLAALDRHDEVVTESDRTLELAARAGGDHELDVDVFLARRDALVALGEPTQAEVALARAQARFDRRHEAIEQDDLRQSHAALPANQRLRTLEE
jgi:eukaryotic-like serine/threonine-protein kinase